MMTISGVGRLGKDAEVRYTANNMAVTSFSVACSEKHKGVETTTWVECVIFGERGVKVSEYIRKGDRFGFSGQGKLEQWEAKDGTMRSTLKCALSDFELMGEPRQAQEQKAPAAKQAAPQGDFDDFQDTDLPF